MDNRLVLAELFVEVLKTRDSENAVLREITRSDLAMTKDKFEENQEKLQQLRDFENSLSSRLVELIKKGTLLPSDLASSDLRDFTYLALKRALSAEALSVLKDEATHLHVATCHRYQYQTACNWTREKADGNEFRAGEIHLKYLVKAYNMKSAGVSVESFLTALYLFEHDEELLKENV